jgi:hypothetical protein
VSCDTLGYIARSCIKTKVVWQWQFRTNILATQDIELRTIIIGGKSRKIIHKTPSWKFPTGSRAAGLAQ